MNTVDFGFQRELSIRALIIRFPYISTSTLRRIFFDFDSGERKARQVLQRMVEKQVIRRFKHGYEYVYYCGAKSPQWLHTHGITTFHFDLHFSLRAPQDIVYQKREFEYPGGRADALYYVKLKEDGSGVKFFLEWDDGKNYWTKFEQYEAYARSRTWMVKEFWADPLKSGRPSFPMVFVVTERELEVPKSEILKVKICRPGSDYLGVLLNG
jgi:hypothetical protein